MENLMQFLKVSWHCLKMLFRDIKTDHRKCEIIIKDKITGRIRRFHYCTCGYNDSSIPNDTNKRF